MSSASVIVTGAGGFIGSHVAADFARRGWRVGAAGHPGRDCEYAQICRWGAIDRALLSELAADLGGIDAIIHCAGGSSVETSLKKPAEDFEHTVMSTVHVLEFLRRHSPQARLVFLSSAAVYGAGLSAPVHEDLPKLPISPHGAHKALAEALIASWAEQYGLQATTLRLFSAYGPGLREGLLWSVCQSAFAGENPITLHGTGEERLDLIAVEDVLALVARVSDPMVEPPSVMNVGTGSGTSVRALAENLIGALGCASSVRFNGKANAGDPLTVVADMRRAQAFGFTPAISLEQGLADYTTWARREA